MSEPGGEVIVYRSPDGQSLVQLRAVAGTVWLAQAQIAALYDTSVPNIAQLIRRILKDGEASTATINSELRVQTDGTRRIRREVEIYNLDICDGSRPRADRLLIRSTWWARPVPATTADTSARRAPRDGQMSSESRRVTDTKPGGSPSRSTSSENHR
ncbi:MAG: hypothetical protein ACRDST_02990 [Pseudonocardiaceae bacterium]